MRYYVWEVAGMQPYVNTFPKLAIRSEIVPVYVFIVMEVWNSKQLVTTHKGMKYLNFLRRPNYKLCSIKESVGCKMVSVEGWVGISVKAYLVAGSKTSLHRNYKQNRMPCVTAYIRRWQRM